MLRALTDWTCGALAHELGVGTMTLYWIRAEQQERSRSGRDRLFAGLSFPAADRMETLIRRGVTPSARRYLGTRRAVRSRSAAAHSGMVSPDRRVIAVFRRAGFGPSDAADRVLHRLQLRDRLLHVRDVSLSVRNQPDIDIKGYAQLIKQYIESLPAERYPNLPSRGAPAYSARVSTSVSPLGSIASWQVSRPGWPRPHILI